MTNAGLGLAVRNSSVILVQMNNVCTSMYFDLDCSARSRHAAGEIVPKIDQEHGKELFWEAFLKPAFVKATSTDKRIQKASFQLMTAGCA